MNVKQRHDVQAAVGGVSLGSRGYARDASRLRGHRPVSDGDVVSGGVQYERHRIGPFALPRDGFRPLQRERPQATRDQRAGKSP